jgi:antitoxin component YwqK of YwqJK toxin-antitoxin module
MVIGFYDNGVTGAIYHYEQGKYSGEVLDFYNNGILKSRFVYDQNFILSGANYFPNGQMIGNLTFVNGRLTRGVYFHQNGHKRSEGNFRYDRKIGKWFNYDSLGVLKDSTYYPDPVGERIRKAKEFKQNSPSDSH